MEKLSIEQLM